ncbi:hypothetical protein GCM10010193_68550 [Kitasatospora atroaurantiaca]|uniref:Alanine-rich protein n=1 Tax=Kitasatospora atroaurantiaca TaxID=285545 RepID=A0A561EKT5_9ACTN|nr:hypothetical protein [Kitasatospora atroaurantiaca]TWE16182.1 hypothetical protein FB465_1149 [Kitasatospora atroaurantiaca]
MRTAAFLYPWDVVGDPDAPRRLAELGVQQVTLASAYHSTRALTPRHPSRRIVTARHSAVYFPTSSTRWRGRRLRPYAQGWIPGPDPFGEASSALLAAGFEVHSWVVLAHNSRLGEENPRCTVENAYGENYPWAPCIAQQEVVDYCADLAAEAAARPGASGVELESCGWYGLAHLHAHDKIAGVRLGPAGQFLMSLCFCAACRSGYARPDALRGAVLAGLEPLWRGAEEPEGASEWERIERLLGADLAEEALAHRTAAARRFQRTVIEAVRAAADADFRILLHADPAPYRCGPNPGVEADWLLGLADGLVLPNPSATLPAATPHRRPGTTLAANLGIVAGMGGSPAALAAVPGADELRLYHAGLASDADLSAVAAALRG